ncbi:MAG: YkgJ family cysteine cluster protein [Candidatus Magnetominusculus sp. LBB02]|nr:YkgJ family cysteine cluster protein [Candidatus Magnetominusculus sp. LBB02]
MDDKPPWRLRYPECEQRLPWLSMLLESYAIFDKGIAHAIKKEIKKHKLRLACMNNCDNCCRTHADIPVYPHEMPGIYWYVAEQMDSSLRTALRGRIISPAADSSCLFLINSSCAVHPVRPAACRQFNVFNRQCAEGEDPFFTRRKDVLTPDKQNTDKAFYAVLPFYGITSEAEKNKAIKTQIIHTQAKNLKSLKWQALLKAMDDFDNR